MKELVDLKKFGVAILCKAKTNMGLVLLIVFGFVFGSAWANKSITEDCKFMGSFRDGPYTYTCQVKAR